MKILVTGATGFIGKHLVQRLIEQGNRIHILYRSEVKISDLHHPDILLFKGDILTIQSLQKAMKDCDYVLHLAAYAKVWARQKQTYYTSNYTGTMNILETALENKIKKVIVVSTAGVFGPSSNDLMVDETTRRTIPYFSEYERTKDLADRSIIENYANKLHVCIVCPTRVFGPGELSESNSVTRLIRLYTRGKFRFLPGNGQSIGNYVFVDDVVNGMLLALENGKTGERYILGGDNISYTGFFSLLSKITGKTYKMFKLPVRLILLVAGFLKLLAVLFRIPPLITPGWARKYLYNWNVSSEKARQELNYTTHPLEEGITVTLNWFKNEL